MKGSSVLIFLLLSVLHVYLGSGPIRTFSPTYDEPIHLTAGEAYWKTGDIRLNGTGHPPFAEAWAALPVQWLNPEFPRFHPLWVAHRWNAYDQYRFADVFLYRNRISADRMIQSGRWAILLLSLLLGALIVYGGVRMGGRPGGLIAGWFWAFSPTIIAHGTLVTTDLAFAVFFFGFFLFLSRPQRRWEWAAAGVCLGLCFASKYLAVAVGPVLAAWGLWIFFQSKKEATAALREKWPNGLIVIGTAIVVLWIVLRGQTGVFAEGIRRTIFRAQSGRSSFFWGRHGTQGWLAYFPAAFLLKTPLSVLAAFTLALFLKIKNKVRWPVFLWLAPVVFFGIACFSRVQIGHRHILAVYPFIFLFIGVMLSTLSARTRWIAAVPMIGLAGTAFAVRPSYLSFFNAFAGGPRHAARYFTDSNIDWGQDLKGLAAALPVDIKKNGLYLTYFGTADPHAYGIRYINVGSDDISGHKDDAADPSVRPDWFAISVTHAKATYYADKTIFDWLKDYEPIRMIGSSLYVYDFTHEPHAKKILERMSGR